MGDLKEWLKGKKSYFIALGIALTAAAEYLQVIDAGTSGTIKTFLTAGGIGTFAAKVNRAVSNGGGS